MQINHNINAMITQHALYNNSTAMGKSLEKLSTGLKINRAQDDAAGLAMSEQMRTQIRGLGKAKQNAQDGIAALQIGEGGLAEISNIMQRQRELAIQSANDTLTSTERKYLNLEFQELTREIARIAKTTDYNGKNMLNYNKDPNLSFGAVTNDGTAASYTLHIGANYSGMLGPDGKYANEMAITYTTIQADPKTGTVTVAGVRFGGANGLKITSQTFSTQAIDGIDKAIKSISGVRAKIGTFVNRLEYTINNIASLEFNTQDAESRIRDTDFAKATTDFTRNQILVQSATSMLSQANALPQTALTLING